MTHEVHRPRGLNRAGQVVIVLAAVCVGLWEAMHMVGILTGWTPFMLLPGEHWVPATTIPQVTALGFDDATRTAPVTVLGIGVRLLGAAEAALRGVLGVIVLLAAASIVSHAAQGRPFEARLVRQLRTIGLVVLAGIVVDVVLDLAVVKAFEAWFRDHSHATHSGMMGATHVAPWWLMVIIGIVAIALASAFARGRELQEDTRGLV